MATADTPKNKSKAKPGGKTELQSGPPGGTFVGALSLASSGAGPLTSHIIGHTSTLKALVEAQTRQRLASTLLFVGPSGSGKKLCALALAQNLVCDNLSPAGIACGLCGPCLRIAKLQSESLMLISPEGSGIKIEQIRDILQFIHLQKLGRARIVIIDQAHLLNLQAGNALLKSLEEPPNGTYFILITPLAAAVLPTIRSRAQLVRFRPLGDSELGAVLGPEADPWVVRMAQGSVELAQQLSSDREDFLELEDALLQFLKTAATSFPGEQTARLKELMKERSAQSFVASMLQRFIADSLRAQGGAQVSGLRLWSELAELSKPVSPADLDRLASFALAMEGEMARNIERGLILENLAILWRRAVSGTVVPSTLVAKPVSNDHRSKAD